MVSNYLKGKRDEMIDLMAWNADGTRMPAKMHTQYLYGLYLNDDLAHDRYQGRGGSRPPVRHPRADVRRRHRDGPRRPWQSVYKIDRYVQSDEFTFLLTSGGHNAGIISGPSHPKRRHRVRTRRPGEPRVSADAWLASTEQQAGSWWPVWGEWLRSRSAAGRVAPPALGAAEAGYAALADAPGEYVRQR
jgi:polyhydroxyalkanoate synthase subunit PhaC